MLPLSSGWNEIEEHLKKYDESVIRDLADDIDTLLVFVSALVLVFIRLVYAY